MNGANNFSLRMLVVSSADFPLSIAKSISRVFSDSHRHWRRFYFGRADQQLG